MPDKNKFMQIKSALQSLNDMVASYESDFGSATPGGDAYQEDAFKDEAYDDGGQASAPLKGFNATAKVDEQGKSQGDGGESKKKKMSLMSSMLKKKMGSY
jgi:hypothetical protein